MVEEEFSKGISKARFMFYIGNRNKLWFTKMKYIDKNYIQREKTLDTLKIPALTEILALVQCLETKGFPTGFRYDVGCWDQIVYSKHSGNITGRVLVEYIFS